MCVRLGARDHQGRQEQEGRKWVRKDREGAYQAGTTPRGGICPATTLTPTPRQEVANKVEDRHTCNTT